jgi:hypothetical protein
VQQHTCSTKIPVTALYFPAEKYFTLKLFAASLMTMGLQQVLALSHQLMSQVLFGSSSKKG